MGKTTLTVNLAFSLAKLGKTVLLVDADPQCNLTSYLVESAVVDKWLDESDAKTGRTLWSALSPVINEGKALSVPSAFERAERVHLLPGDIRLSEYEADLQQSWLDCLQRKLRGFASTTALSSLVEVVGRTIEADYVLYDVGPNIGPLNRAVILDCDYFVVPAACDHFSTRALKTLGHSVAGWIRDWEVISKIAPRDVRLLKGRPVYLGYVLQRFRMYGGEISSADREHARQLDKHSHSDVTAVLREVEPSLAPGTPSQFKLGQIKDFAKISKLAQVQGVAFEDVSGGAPYLAVEAAKAFGSLAQRIVSRIEG